MKQLHIHHQQSSFCDPKLHSQLGFWKIITRKAIIRDVVDQQCKPEEKETRTNDKYHTIIGLDYLQAMTRISLQIDIFLPRLHTVVQSEHS